MGNLTTLHIYNDDIDQIKKNPKQFVENLINAVNSNKEQDISCGNSANAGRVMKTSHMDVGRLFIQNGNTLSDLTPYYNTHKLNDKIKREFLKENLKIAKQMIKRMEQMLKDTQ